VHTNHSKNPVEQQQWNTRLARMKAGNENFELCLQLENVI